MSLFIRGNFVGNKGQKNNNQGNKIQEVDIVSNFCKSHSFLASSRNFFASASVTIPAIKRSVNVDSVCGVNPDIWGSIKTRTNQAAATLTKSSEVISNQPFTTPVYSETKNKSILILRTSLKNCANHKI